MPTVIHMLGLHLQGTQLFIRSFELGVLFLPSLEARYLQHPHRGFSCTPPETPKDPTTEDAGPSTGSSDPAASPPAATAGKPTLHRAVQAMEAAQLEGLDINLLSLQGCDTVSAVLRHRITAQSGGALMATSRLLSFRFRLASSWHMCCQHTYCKYTFADLVAGLPTGNEEPQPPAESMPVVELWTSQAGTADGSEPSSSSRGASRCDFQTVA